LVNYKKIVPQSVRNYIYEHGDEVDVNKLSTTAAVKFKRILSVLKYRDQLSLKISRLSDRLDLAKSHITQTSPVEKRKRQKRSKKNVYSRLCYD